MNTGSKTIDLKTVLLTIFSIMVMWASCLLFFISLDSILNVASKTDSRKLIEIGFYWCVAVILFTIVYTQIRKLINLKKNSRTFYNSRRTWRFTWTIGGILTFLAYMVDHHILFLNWYFLGVGLISLFNSFYKYAELDEMKITLYYGIFFNRKRLELNWSQISDIGQKTVKRTGTISAGGRLWVSSRHEYEENVFLIMLKRPLSETLCKSLNNSNKINIFVNEYHINEERNEIKLNTEPQAGFDHLSYAAKTILFPKEQIDKPMSKALFYAIEISGFVIFFIIMIMQLFVWLIQFPK